MAESPSSPLSPSTPTSEKITVPDKKEYKAFYALQDNNICLQNEVKSKVQKLIKIKKTSSNSLKKWKSDWDKFYADKRNKVPNFETIWDLFNIAFSSIDECTDRVDGIIDDLERVHESISEPTPEQTLKFKIDEARTTMDAMDKELIRLQNERKNCQKAIDNFGERSLRNKFSCIGPQQDEEVLVNRQASTDISIATAESNLRREVKNFNKRKARLYKESKKAEMDRCEQLKIASGEFLESLKIPSDDHVALSKKYDPESDFNKWETNYSRQDSRRTPKSPSVKENNKNK